MGLLGIIKVKLLKILVNQLLMCVLRQSKLYKDKKVSLSYVKIC